MFAISDIEDLTSLIKHLEMRDDPVLLLEAHDASYLFLFKVINEHLSFVLAHVLEPE